MIVEEVEVVVVTYLATPGTADCCESQARVSAETRHPTPL